MKPIVPSQSKSPASVTRLAEMSGSLLKELPLTAESGGATRAALLAMRAHRGTGSSNPLPSSGESANYRFLRYLNRASATVETRWAMAGLVLANLAAHFAERKPVAPISLTG